MSTEVKKEGIESPGTGITNDCKPLLVLRTEPGPLQEQQMLLTAATSFQPLSRLFLNIFKMSFLYGLQVAFTLVLSFKHLLTVLCECLDHSCVM